MKALYYFSPRRNYARKPTYHPRKRFRDYNGTNGERNRVLLQIMGRRSTLVVMVVIGTMYTKHLFNYKFY